MNYNLNLGLKGEYKVDIYSGKNLVESTDWFSNDITNVGLTYPLSYSFAQCFMFLSLGSETHGVTNNQPYTGLANAIKSFKVVKNSNGILTYTGQSGQYIGWPGYEVGAYKTTNATANPATTCGTRITEKGLRMYRGWTIPTGDSASEQYSMGENLDIQQLMVSPSSGSDEKGNKAFSLVDRSITIPSGYTATITYQLSIDFENFKLPYTFFSGKNVQGTNGFFDTGKAVTGVNGSNELELLSGWSNLSGIFRQILPGIELVDNFGSCFIQDKMGSDMEPSKVDCRNTNFYLSADISQFAISKSGIYGGEYEAYNSNGLCMNYFELVKATGGTFDFISINATNGNKAYGSEGGNKWFYSGGSQSSTASNPEEDKLFQKIKNIRLENLLNIENYKTGSLTLSYLTSRYTGAKNFPVAFATPGKIGFDNSLPDFGQKVVLSTNLKRMPISPNVLDTGNRTKYVTKKAIIPPINSYGHNSRYGSLVLGYLYNKASSSLVQTYNFSPYLDFLFFDNQGRGANMSHYRIPTIYLSERGSGIAKIRFDVTGVDGNQAGPIGRLSGVYGFMGNGVSNIGNPSGLNFNHPLLTAQLNSNFNNYYIPPGPKYSGLLLEGENLNENDSGDISYRNGTGWGAVYGLVVNENYYSKGYDSVLIDVPNWSGFGRIPNPTGDNQFLYWPNRENKFSGGLKVSEVAYFLKNTGVLFPDPGNDYFDNYQIIDDIIYNDGQGFSVSLFDLTGSNGQPRFYFRTDAGALLPAGSNDVVTGYLSSGRTAIQKSEIIQFSRQAYNNYKTIKSINLNRFINQEIKESDIAKYYFTTTSNLTLDPSAAFIVSLSSYYLSYSGDNGSNFTNLNNTGYFKIISTKFKKPIAQLRHVENIGNEGFRLLPNYAIPNNNAINTYSPTTGGSFPGLSTENGMELYLTISWTGA